MATKTMQAAARKAEAAKPVARARPARAEAVKNEKGHATRCRFFLAEDVRDEKDGKVSLIGLYTNDVMVALMHRGTPNPSLETPALLNAALLVSVEAAPGVHTAGFQIRVPGGERPFDMSTQQFEVAEGSEAMNLIFRMQPLPFFGFGEGEVTVFVDGQPCEYRFEVRRRDLNDAPRIKMATKEPSR